MHKLLNSILKRLKGSKLVKDSFWSLLGNVIGKGLALLAGILVARFLGRDLYGEYGLIRTTILTIGIFSTFGLGYTATKYVAQLKKDCPEKLKIFVKYATFITLAFSGLMSLLLFIFAKEVSSEVFKINHLQKPLRILAVLIVFNAITTTQIGLLSGFGKFKELAKISSYMGVITFLFSAVLTYFFLLEGALIALVIVQLLNCVSNFLLVQKQLKIHPTFITNDKELFWDIIKFSLPIALQECTYSSAGWLTSIMLVRFSSVGELGMYSAAMQWNAIILFIPGILRNVVLSHLSSSTNDQKNHSRILKQTVLINLISTLLLCGVVIIGAPLIAKGYGKTFEGLNLLISLAVFITVFMSVTNVYSQAYTSLGKNWLMFYIRLWRDVGALVISFIFLYYKIYEGAMALIISKLFVYIVFLVLMLYVYKKISKSMTTHDEE